MSVLVSILAWISFALGVLFTVMYAHQIFYLFVGLIKQPKLKKTEFQKHKFAVIIPAKNEEAVVGHLIDSIKNQNYPSDLIDIIVGDDGSTDNTAKIANEKGAIVITRNNSEKKGKGYLLEYLFNILLSDDYKNKNYEAFLVLDADNLLETNYIEEINKVFDSGYEVITSYRNSKNFGQNWISSGYATWFLRESRYLNGPRMVLNTSCAISGTGWVISKKVMEEFGGWKCALLTEDIEFTTDYVLKGGKIGYAKDAVLYDEQPYTFKQSWNQRKRWAKGFYQVVGKNGGKLIKSFFSKNGFSCYDMFTTIAPALLVSLGMMIVDLGFFICGLCMLSSEIMIASALTLAIQLAYFYALLFVVGMLTIITEWKKIHTTTFKKIITMFTFPLFMFTYFPIAVTALFQKNVTWVPIKHDQSITVSDIKNNNTIVEIADSSDVNCDEDEDEQATKKFVNG